MRDRSGVKIIAVNELLRICAFEITPPLSYCNRIAKAILLQKRVAMILLKDSEESLVLPIFQ